MTSLTLVNLAIVSFWTLSAFIGLIFRVRLLFKYLGDRRAAVAVLGTKEVMAIVDRNIESSVIHIIIKVAMTLFGVNGFLIYLNHPATTTPMVLTTIVFLSIAWLLTYDAYRDSKFQSWLLSNVTKVRRITEERR